jgi:hypothetical protein
LEEEGGDDVDGDDPGEGDAGWGEVLVSGLGREEDQEGTYA